ncbi:hypothetical protein PENSPDRAFT_662754 [Peniophora sp. CONT]|nr:hypothetical protein PENSPDRAFT_662754 [Peniophora sp. CONT]
MQVDSAYSPSPFCNPSENDIADFLNLDLFSHAGPSGSSTSPPSSGSRASSHSPAPSDPLHTPPQPFSAESDPFGLVQPDFFSFSQPFDYTKQDPLAPPQPTGAPFDFLAAFNTAAPAQFAIDPQLVHTPAASPDAGSGSSGSDKHSSPEEMQHEGDDERSHAEDSASPASPTGTEVAPLKAGGKGKARRGTVQSGGITKKPAVSAVVRNKDPIDDDDEADDWRPSPEEYKKMSSKEKRQLRNKISARNFRVRRKEYITTLEGDIAERDRLIDAIRSELGSTKSENAALRYEIDALKKALLTTPDAPMLPPPGPLPSASPAPPASNKQLLTPNMHKDVPASPSAGANKAFWAGHNGMFGGGVTSVHTTLIPESFARPLENATPKGRLQENMNPALNAPTPATANNGMGAVGGRFDAFADQNPFTMKMLDAYRMQLWTRMAQQTRQQQQMQQHMANVAAQNQHKDSPAVNGLAAGLRPAFFSSARSPALSSLLSGKHSSSAPSPSSAAAAYPSPPASPRASDRKPVSPMAGPSASQQEQAVLAAMASQTLIGRLGSAFWDAFAGGAGHNNKGVDADKVRRVLEGSAVVRVVDVDEPAPRTPASPRMAATTSPKPALRSTPSMPRMATGLGACERENAFDALSGAFGALSLGKK